MLWRVGRIELSAHYSKYAWSIGLCGNVSSDIAVAGFTFLGWQCYFRVYLKVRPPLYKLIPEEFKKYPNEKVTIC